MKIAISGSNGYIAKNLIQELELSDYEIVRIGRSQIYNIAELAEILSDVSVVIHLAGSPILKRWTSTIKDEILRSRIATTRNIIQTIKNLPIEKRPKIFISASAVGIYSPDKIHTEESTSFSTDFVSEVVVKWEDSSADLNPNVRRVIFRVGLILGKGAKTIQNFVPVTKLGLGGKIGSGKQPFPFIHIHDAVKAIKWSIENHQAQGIYNLVAPENIDNKTFTNKLAKSLNRPAIFTVPEFILKIVFGEASILLLQSPQVYPKRLLDEGFEFNYPDLDSTIEEIVQ